MQAFTLTIKYLAIDFVGGILRWPVWWYSRGFILVGTWGIGSIKGYAKSIALAVWIKNIFVPMFGYYDWQSRLISFFMRIAQIIGRGVALVLWTVIVLFLLVGYLTLPILAFFAAMFHLTGGIFGL
ncbi:MAG: hypothetical protein Q8P30_00840 [Candidatus Uhrbacteria bacterium]|nr:hypothetical protein [Candidatus Uhrbacteria bacterium]